MYPPNQPKIPPVRPRSSLSTDDARFKGLHPRRPLTKGFVSLLGLCLLLFVLCGVLLGALVLVGRSMVNESGTSNQLVGGVRAADDVNVTLEDSLNPTPVPVGGASAAAGDKKSYFVQLQNCSQRVQKINLRPNKVAAKSAASNNNKSRIMSASKVLSQITYRLPHEIRPKGYKLFLQPNLEKKTFAGNITIRLEVVKPLSFIPVHAKKLSVTTVDFYRVDASGKRSADSLKPSLTFDHPEFEYWVTEFEKALDVGEYALQLGFNGSLTDRIVGFYQSSYFDETRNQTRWIATSKFEPTYARQAFPCFDEPAMKAPFVITLVRPTEGGYSALSNMNQESEVVKGDLTEVTFAESVPMSTYLACFIVSDFVYKEEVVQSNGIGPNFQMRVFATPAQLNKVDFALTTGVGITEFYIQYFGIEYPLPKLDMAAIPDFVSGAMEHWGLVTFRETSLLYDSTISSTANKQRVATVVGHELAHMWFGNLVTMKWWNDLWLNEGFASYIEYKGVNHVYPTWKMLDQFLLDDLHGVMRLDATLASHPIVQTVESPDQITELFDAITYSKGASIIRMLEDFTGAADFQEAVTNYLNRFKYSNADTNDLLTEIEALGPDHDVKLVMRTWTEQMGLPVLELTRESFGQYKVTQKRFFSNPEDNNTTFNDSPFNYRWSIPITYYDSENSEVQRKWFNYNDAEIILSFNTNTKWFKLNKDQVGYYRINYPVDIWTSLTTALVENVEVLSTADRAHLLNDAFALADATQLSYDIALDLTKYLKNEVEYVPWSVAATKLLSLKKILYYTTIFKNYSTYARQLVDKAYGEVSWEVGDDHLKNLLRVTILNAACSLGHEGCLNEVAERFNKWMANPADKPNPDLRNTIYYYGMKQSGTEKAWDTMWQLFKTEMDANEKVKLMSGLAGIQEPWILKRFIDLAWDENNVRSQDYFSCLQNIAANRVGESLVWDYVRENWQKMVDRFSLNERYLGRMIPAITSGFSTNIKLEEMDTFFAKYPEAGAGTAARKQALENVKNNIKWLEENTEKIVKWLGEQDQA